MRERALILGCGYTGIRLARELIAGGHPVAGTTRDEKRAGRLRAEGIEPVLYAAARPERLSDAPGEPPEVAFYLIPPLRDPGGADPGEADPEAAEGRGAGTALRALAARGLRDFVYVSSTSVYGDRAGAWVDERDEPAPDSPLGRARLAEEEGVREAARASGVEARVARVAGIYGPGRTLGEAIRSGRWERIEGLDSWSNRIHVDDLVQGLLAVWRRGEPGGTYNLSDGRPHRSSEYARLTADLLGLELPSVPEAEARERYGEDRLARKLSSRRVSNRRLREELGVRLRYPSYREGVPAALRAERAGRE